ncbi:MAG: arginase [Bacteriovorax sp. MedPE-SWde]|nr:MAG: arginase [Bacteriovorax sp. MedPE-SWde]
MNNKIINNFKSYLCPPGAGVFTVNTAKERKDSLYKSLYGSSENVDEKWKLSFEKLESAKGSVLLGVCSDCGGGIQRGANWGPLFLRNTLLNDHKELRYHDIGDIRVIPHLLHDKYLNEGTIQSCKNALYQEKDSVYPVAPLSITEKCCNDIYEHYKDVGIFAIGGDHSVSYPLVKSWIQNKRKDGKKVGIIHFDAHTDLLRERLGIDLCFGSWLTHVLGELESPKSCYQFGIRSSGKDRAYWENEFGLNQYWAKDVKEIGPQELAKNVTQELLDQGIDEVYVSFDIDAIDSSLAPATGTPEAEGLFPHECLMILKEINSKIKITAADMVEIAPLVGNDKAGSDSTLQVGASISAYLIEAINNAHN